MKYLNEIETFAQKDDCVARANNRPVQMSSVYIVIADISGYTQFIQQHANDLAHAEQVVAELLESIISVAQPPLTVHELSGDAVSFYAHADENVSTPASILKQVRKFFVSFNEKMQEILQCPIVSNCLSCERVGELKMKVVIHFGDVVLTEIGGFSKIAGPAMILAHRLLKNSVQGNEYLLITSDFYDRCEEGMWERAVWKNEEYDDFGEVLVLVQFPVGVKPRFASREMHFNNRDRRHRGRTKHGELFLR